MRASEKMLATCIGPDILLCTVQTFKFLQPSEHAWTDMAKKILDKDSAQVSKDRTTLKADTSTTQYKLPHDVHSPHLTTTIDAPFLTACLDSSKGK